MCPGKGSFSDWGVDSGEVLLSQVQGISARKITVISKFTCVTCLDEIPQN